MSKTSKYAVILILSIIVFVLGRYLVSYFNGTIYLKSEEYTWFVGESEKISYYKNSARSKDEICETGITIKLKGNKTYFTIAKQTNWNPCYIVIDNDTFLNKSEKQTIKVALQLKKSQVKKIKEGKFILPNPYVQGLKLDNQTIFTIDDFNKSVNSYSWFQIPFSILLILIALFAILATTMSLFPEKKETK